MEAKIPGNTTARIIQDAGGSLPSRIPTTSSEGGIMSVPARLAVPERTYLREKADLHLTSYDGLDHDLSQARACFPCREQQTLHPRGVSGELLVLVSCASHRGSADRREPAPNKEADISAVVKAIQDIPSNTLRTVQRLEHERGPSDSLLIRSTPRSIKAQ